MHASVCTKTQRFEAPDARHASEENVCVDRATSVVRKQTSLLTSSAIALPPSLARIFFPFTTPPIPRQLCAILAARLWRRDGAMALRGAGARFVFRQPLIACTPRQSAMPPALPFRDIDRRCLFQDSARRWRYFDIIAIMLAPCASLPLALQMIRFLHYREQRPIF
jgi:hypothetical protein